MVWISTVLSFASSSPSSNRLRRRRTGLRDRGATLYLGWKSSSSTQSPSARSGSACCMACLISRCLIDMVSCCRTAMRTVSPGILDQICHTCSSSSPRSRRVEENAMESEPVEVGSTEERTFEDGGQLAAPSSSALGCSPATCRGYNSRALPQKQKANVQKLTRAYGHRTLVDLSCCACAQFALSSQVSIPQVSAFQLFSVS